MINELKFFSVFYLITKKDNLFSFGLIVLIAMYLLLVLIVVKTHCHNHIFLIFFRNFPFFYWLHNPAHAIYLMIRLLFQAIWIKWIILVIHDHSIVTLLLFSIIFVLIFAFFAEFLIFIILIKTILIPLLIVFLSPWILRIYHVSQCSGIYCDLLWSWT